WGKGVAIIARALQGGAGQREIPHRVVTDEAEILLATRVVALCLEPIHDIWISLATGLDLLASVYRVKGNVKKAAQLERNAVDARAQKIRGNAKAPTGLKAVLETVAAGVLTGNPGHDWLTVRRSFAGSNIAELKFVAELVIYLMALNRGRRIADSL